MTARMTRLWLLIRSIGGWRGFYLGLPCIIVGLFLLSVPLLLPKMVGGFPEDLFFPQRATAARDTTALILFGLVVASLAGLIAMFITKYAFKSNRRASLLLTCYVFWGGWGGYVHATTDFGDAAFFRTAFGQRYAIPWDRVPGRVEGMSGQEDPLQRWAFVDPIGFTYCAKPFDARRSAVGGCESGRMLFGRQGLNGSGAYRTDRPEDRDDPDGIGILIELEELERDRREEGAARAAFSALDLGYEHEGVRRPDVGGMIAFEDDEPFRFINLFARTRPSSAGFHRAVCTNGFSSPEQRNGPMMCSHYIRRGERAWVFDLPIEETAIANQRLDQLIEQLEDFEVPLSRAQRRRGYIN